MNLINCKCGKVIPRGNGNYNKHLSSAFHRNYLKNVVYEKWVIENGYKKDKYSDDLITPKKIKLSKHGGSKLKNNCNCNDCINNLIELTIKKKLDNNKK